MIEDLLHYARANRRVCPLPKRGNDLWEMLPARKRVGSGWSPPAPLILAAWWHTSGVKKMVRLRDHLRYAEDCGVLEDVDRFLRSLPETEWTHVHNFGRAAPQNWLLHL